MRKNMYTKILIVDDASFMRVVLRDIIKTNGLASEILEASNGIQAVQMYLQKRPDLVTMDINMPGADGMQALKAIMKANFKAKVVMVTSVEQKHIVKDAIKSGARDYVLKPFDRSSVSLTFNKVLRSR